MLLAMLILVVVLVVGFYPSPNVGVSGGGGPRLFVSSNHDDLGLEEATAAIRTTTEVDTDGGDAYAAADEEKDVRSSHRQLPSAGGDAPHESRGLTAADLFPEAFGRVAKGATRPPFDESAALRRINPLHPYFIKRSELTAYESALSERRQQDTKSKRAVAAGESEGAVVALTVPPQPQWDKAAVHDEEKAVAKRAELEVGYSCPLFKFPGGKSADSQTMQEAANKYTRYTRQYCNTTGMLQMSVVLESYVQIMDKIANLVQMKRGDRLFDWGSGCGTMLNYFHLTHNTTGVGIDLTSEAVQHSMGHRQPQQLFCLMNGANLKSFANETFDNVVSWATLYHVRRTMVQCDIVHNLVRMLKPGGRAFIGHLRTEKTQEYWKKGNKKCKIPGAVMNRYRDFRTFHQPQWRKHGFFSLLVYKLPLGASNGTAV